MNNLIVSQNQTLTMSSREIAEFTDKQHKHVIRDINRLYSELYGHGPELDHVNVEKKLIDGIFVATDSRAYVQYYLLDRKHTDCLLTGYSAIARMKVIERWHELEKVQTPQLPKSKLEWIEFALEQERKLELAAPKVEFVDRFVERESLQNATQVASSLKMKSARALNKALDEIGGVYNGSVKRSRIFTAKFISDGYGDVKQNEAGYPQSLFTTKGVTRIHELLVSEGYI